MAALTSTQFVDAALSSDGPLSLSYKHPNLKWLIRDHFLSLLHNFPSLKPSIDTFTHDDGTTVNLLNASGTLPVSPAIPLTIWIHESYPFFPPLVFLSSTSSTQILRDHPFVYPSGAIFSPYLHVWRYPRSNLLDFACNLVRIFTYYHPFSSLVSSRCIDPSLVSKMEALDFLYMTLHHEIVASRAKAKEDIEALFILQAELVHRAETLNITLEESEHERSSLKERVKDLTDEADTLMNWLTVHGCKSSIDRAKDKMNDAFEAADQESDQVLDCSSKDKAIEDLLYVLEKAVKEGVVPVDKYLKQVRALAREQFFHRAMLVKLRSSDILYQLDDLYGSFSKPT
ncbi:Ubiquitin E2 variant [Macleaya cordata]|uniref:Ubiquitin E2 variant n=1 Tax=Macleaya cordata TaxID=56857 RepID=A0A200QH97_MACCD|nr:Ubiquitin E2 variant [Macleaya cordata]